MACQNCLLALVNQATDLISVVDPEGNYLFLNDRYRQILGTDLSRYLGQSAFDRIHPDDLAQFVDSFSSVTGRKQVQFAPYRLSDDVGNWRWMRPTASDSSQDPAINGIVLISQDITDLVSVTSRLQRAEERDRVLMHAIGEAIFDWDVFEDNLVWTSSFSHHFGYRSVQGNSYEFYNRIYLPDKKRVWAEIEEGMRSVHVKTVFSEFRLHKADGNLATVDCFIIFLRDQSGKVYRAVGSLRNISEYEDHLQNIRRKNAMIREIALSDSHAIRAPLSSMLNVIELMISNPDTQSETKELLKLVLQLANEFNQNIKDLSV